MELNNSNEINIKNINNISLEENKQDFKNSIISNNNSKKRRNKILPLKFRPNNKWRKGDDSIY